MPKGFFYVHGFTSSTLMRISGFYFEMVNWIPQTAIYVWSVSLDNLRIDHNTVNQGNLPIFVGGSKGVIDHNYFYNSNLTITFSAGSDAQANASWDSLVAGTQDALFIEDNFFIDDNNLPKRPWIDDFCFLDSIFFPKILMQMPANKQVYFVFFNKIPY